nr:replicative DNA helicase [Humibacillus xanthopallidus]
MSTSAFAASNREGGPPDDRLPPQDVGAEQSVLGGMLLSKDAIADCVEQLKGTDFYRPAHELIYDAILDLYGRGEPADAITVSDELTKRGDLSRIGGQAYLHQLIASVPTAANAGYYAQIVAERAVLRRLVEAGTRIVQLGYAQGGGDVEDIVNAAQAEVYSVADKRGGEDYHRLGEVIEATVDEIEFASGRSGEMTGVPTSFTDLDALTNGLHAGQMIVIAARPAMGKALALDTPLPTPDGWTTMGEVNVGDFVIGADGRPTLVVAATDVMRDRPCYEVEFSDGSILVADEQHQWLTRSRAERRRGDDGSVRTTGEIAGTVRTATAESRLNHSVTNTAALQLDAVPLPLAPYALGAWLGDGTSAGASITTADPELVMRLESEGLVVRPLTAKMRFSLHLADEAAALRNCVVCGAGFTPTTSQVKTCGRSCGGRAKGLGGYNERPVCPDCGRVSAGLRRCQACREDHGTVTALLRGLGVLGDKHIPQLYLRASEAQRRDLLAGLLDTDGTVTNAGSVQFTVTNRALAEGVRELAVSLGYRCSIATRVVVGRSEESSVAYNVNFTCDEDVFWLPRKALLHKQLRDKGVTRRGSRFISAVRRVASVPVRCIEVAAEDHLYLAGESMIPTHNSTIGLDIVRSAAIKHKMAAVVFSLEMSRTEITMRLLSAEAGIQLQHMRKGTMREEDWTRLASTMGRVSEAPLFIDDSPNMSLMEIRAKCRRLKQRENLKLVVIDYLQLMSSGKRVESRQQEVSEFSRALKLLAKELEVPVIAISQLNRGAEQRTDKKPAMSDLRESGCLTADTRVTLADTGAQMSIAELVEEYRRNPGVELPVWSLDESLRYVKRPMTAVYSTGTRPVFRLTLASGKTVRATENHPFLTTAGWTQLGDLRTGSRIAVPRHVPAPESFVEELDDADLRLGALIMSTRTPDGPSGRLAARGCSIGFDLVEMSRRQLMPDIASFPKRQIGLLIDSLFALDGEVTVDEVAREGRIVLRHPSRRLLDDVAHLLLRFGISTAVAARGDRWELDVRGVDDQRRFLQEVAVHTERSTAAQALLQIVRERSDTVVPEAEPVLSRSSRRVTIRPEDFPEGVVGVDGLSLERLDELFDSLDLDLEAANDVLWDTVVDIEPDGVEEVFDATVLGTHNFIANGIAVHNSIEQDADIVILLHREAAYEKDSPREGEADLIVAKHRNGPTDTIVVAFQGHFSRFTNMATNF